MKKSKYIIDLASGSLDLDGYNYMVSLVRFYIKKYNWPKIILEESSNRNKNWSSDEILGFTQQFLVFVLEKQKLKNYKTIPKNYIEYYYKTVLTSYVSKKIKESQNKIGLSYDDSKRICLELLNEEYIHKEIKGNHIWNISNHFDNPILKSEYVSEILLSLPRILLTPKTKHYKPRVKMALRDIFSLVNKPIKQQILFAEVFNLFDQSSFYVENNESVKLEIREHEVEKVVEEIIDKFDVEDIPVYLDYFFTDKKKSLSQLSEKYGLPKSSIHYKTQQFSKIISNNFTPENDDEGVFFLEKLHNRLDDLK